MEEIPLELLQQAKNMFDKYDLNKNGIIEFEELKILMTDVSKEIGIPSPTEEDVERVMQDTDINRDQRISREEFTQLFKILYVMRTMKKK
jgi:Ca2+-binding EF-hand superfamily protein